MSDRLAKVAQCVPEGIWTSGVTAGSSPSRPIRWVPLFSARDEEFPQIGLSNDGHWVAISLAGAVEISLDSAAWLLALDHSLNELRSLTNRKFASYGVVIDPLPYESIIKQGLEYGNDVGISKAIAWLEEDHGLLTKQEHYRVGERHDRLANLIVAMNPLPVLGKDRLRGWQSVLSGSTAA